MMRLSLSAPKQVQPRVNFQGSLNMEQFFRRKDKVVIVMGATGTGKSRLAIDLATRFPAEIINSDKMQVYKGLDIVTNKVTEEECNGIPHHLLGIVDPHSYFTSTDFRYQASLAMESIINHDRVPIIAGGSNSYIEALVNDDAHEFRFRYDCCFLWVDVWLPALHTLVSERVNQMAEAGLVDEVRRMFDPKLTDYTYGIRRAIGAPELDEFFRAELNGTDDKTLERFLQEAISNIKKNTCKLACCQLQKINRFQDKYNWNLHRLNATEAFAKHGEKSDEAWQRCVVAPSTMIVNQFLYDHDHHTTSIIPSNPVNATVTTEPLSIAAIAALTH